jgi:hypothetical protein
VQKNGNEYTDGNLLVCPTTNQDILATAYLRFKHEGVLDYLCFENKPDLATFLSALLSPGSLTLAAFLKTESITTDDSRVTLTGLAHLTKPFEIGGGHLRSDMLFAFYREFQDGVWTRRSAKLMLDFTFERTHLDSVFGYTAIQNKAMIRFAKSLGYKQVILEGYSSWRGNITDVVVSSMTRTRWESNKTK